MSDSGCLDCERSPDGVCNFHMHRGRAVVKEYHCSCYGDVCDPTCTYCAGFEDRWRSYWCRVTTEWSNLHE